MSNTKNRRLSRLILIAVSPFITCFICCNHPSLKTGVDQKMINTQIDTCNNPDADINCCFVFMPSELTPVMSIAVQNEPGEKLLITGTIFKSDGVTPYPDVILYAYHTDNSGHYSRKGDENGFQKWHGHLHGWCKTGSNGKYEIQTLRPARYPGVFSEVVGGGAANDSAANNRNIYVFHGRYSAQ